MKNDNLGLLTAHYKKNFSTLVQKLTRKAGTEWDSQDAVHDAYERGIKYYASYDPEKAVFNVWFGRLLVNAVKDHVKKNKGHTDLEFDEELAEGTPCTHYTEKVEKEIRAKIAERKPHIAEILNLYFHCGYSAKDISRIVDSSHVAINQTINRFREELRKEYKDGGSLEA